MTRDEFGWTDCVAVTICGCNYQSHRHDPFPVPYDSAFASLVDAHRYGWKLSSLPGDRELIANGMMLFAHRCATQCLRTENAFFFCEAMAALDCGLPFVQDPRDSNTVIAVLFDVYHRLHPAGVLTDLPRYPTFRAAWDEFEDDWLRRYDDSPREWSLQRWGLLLVETPQGLTYKYKIELGQF